MKTVLLCILCLVVGAGGGAAVGAYVMRGVHEKWVAFYLASGLALTAMQAEQIKMGEAPLLLHSDEQPRASAETAVTLLKPGSFLFF